MTDAAWRARAERVLLRHIPPFLRGQEELWARSPWFFTRASGARLRAMDGREYLDLEMGRGPNILGYSHPVTEAARDAFRGATARTALYHPSEVELAELVVGLVPCAERVVFAKNGSDATTAAVRVARTVTGRDVIISSGYHGFGDWCAADTPDTPGFPAAFRGWSETVELNDRDGLARAAEKHRGNLAGLVIEPAHRILPEPGFLEMCRNVADANDALLVFDEVVTAFRLDLGGAQGRYGVVPDLACLGKAMANGLPISALVGRRDLLDALDRSFFSMTFMHDNPTFAVATACLRYLCETGALAAIAKKGERLRRAFDAAAARHGLAARAVGFSARLDLDFSPTDSLTVVGQRSLFGSALLDCGILPTATIFACELLSDSDIDAAVEAFELGMTRIRQHLGDNPGGTASSPVPEPEQLQR